MADPIKQAIAHDGDCYPFCLNGIHVTMFYVSSNTPLTISEVVKQTDSIPFDGYQGRRIVKLKTMSNPDVPSPINCKDLIIKTGPNKGKMLHEVEDGTTKYIYGACVYWRFLDDHCDKEPIRAKENTLQRES